MSGTWVAGGCGCDCGCGFALLPALCVGLGWEARIDGVASGAALRCTRRTVVSKANAVMLDVCCAGELVATMGIGVADGGSCRARGGSWPYLKNGAEQRCEENSHREVAQRLVARRRTRSYHNCMQAMAGQHQVGGSFLRLAARRRSRGIAVH